MADDIVKRLRSFAELGDIGSVAMEDAADEIVNLRAARTNRCRRSRRKPGTPSSRRR